MAKNKGEKVSKELVNKTTGEITTYDAAAWGGGPELTAADVIIPRILFMQPMSPQVTDGKAKFGEFRESLNSELFGEFDKGFNVIPFYMEKVWIEYEIKAPARAGGEREKKYLQTVPITPDNETLKYQDEAIVEGVRVNIERDRVMNFYVLLEKELELGSAIPYILSVRKSSLSAGKKLTTQMYMKNSRAGKSPAAMKMQIFAARQSGIVDGKTVTYGVVDVKPVELAKDAHVAEAFHWFGIIRSGKAKVHAESYDQEEGSRNVGPKPTGKGSPATEDEIPF